MVTAVAASLLFPATSRSQMQTPPAPAAPRSVTVPQPVEKTLSNGLRVIVIPKHDTPLAAARLTVMTGGEADPATLGGLAQLTASLLNQGTKTRTAEQLASGVEALGATLQSDASWDMSTVDVSVLATKLPQALGYVSDVVRNPTFNKDDVERLRQQTLDGLSVSLRQPRSLAGYVASRVVFGETPYAHNLGGTPESVTRITPDDVKAFHAKDYRPENSLLVIGGDVDAEKMFALAEKEFGSWKRGEASAAASATAALPSQPRVVVIDMPEAGQAAVVVSRPGLRRVDPAFYQAAVANAVLGGGYSARLNQEIRIKRGLSYGANSLFQSRRSVGPFSASTETKNESAAEVAGIIVDEMSRLATADIPETELKPRKAVLIGNFGRSLETTSGLVGRVASLAAYGIDLNESNDYIASVEKVTADDVKTFAAEHLPGASANVVIVGDAKKFIEPLKKRFGNVEVIPVAELDLGASGLRKGK